MPQGNTVTMQAQQLPLKRDRLIRLPEVESTTGSKKSTIYKLVKDGAFPQPVRLSRRLVAWSEAAVQGWIRTQGTSRAHSNRAESDRASALRASEEARAARIREPATESAQTRRCIQCGAPAPAHLEEGEGPPCGCL